MLLMCSSKHLFLKDGPQYKYDDVASSGIIIDVVSIFMWMFADNWIMVIQFIFWAMNCIYGYRK